MMMRNISILLAISLFTASAAAQSAGRTSLRGAEIQGLELGLEGALSAPRGGHLRWLLTAYEVIGTSDLRPGADAGIQLTTALDPSAPTVPMRTDASGRATLELAIPEDAPDAFPVVLRVLSRGVVRRFELTVRVTEPRAIQLWVARAQVPREGRVHAFGRLSEARTGRAIANVEVRLVARDAHDHPLGAPIVVRTDAAGLFAHVFAVGRDVVGQVSIEARAEDAEENVVSARASALVAEPAAPALLVSIAPERRVIEPGAAIAVDVVARRPDGRPVPNALVELSGFEHDDPGRTARTDATGRTRMAWRAPAIGGAWSDATIHATVTREGLGRGDGQATVRVSRVDHVASLAVEGGALIPELGGRIFVRVVDLEGRAASAGVPVRISGPRLGAERTATTDASGVATFDVSITGNDASGHCGGDAQAAVTIRVGDGPRAFEREVCLPLDADGTARVRADEVRVRSGALLRLEIARAASVARAPIAVSVLAVESGLQHAVAARVLAPGETRIELPIPEDVAGPLLVRARPIIEGREVRGGSALVFAEAGAPLAIDAALDASGLRTASTTSDVITARAWTIALPLDEARALAQTIRHDALGPLATLRTEPATASPALIAGALSAATPIDVGAPFVLREGRTIPMPTPDDPVAQGLLRDPWRAQSRFLTGRLALVFSAIERQVAGAVPGRIDDVAVQTNGRWDFNAQILAALEGSGDLGAEGATGLGGEPLTIEQLRRVDPAFTYDRVAARITRERLYRLMVALRRFVQSNGFDLPWARLGDPSTWLRHLSSMWIDGVGQIPARELVDAWGRPFVLRAITGRARFAAWSPLPGWELFSSGPDGIPGNGDDVADPSARVLPSGSPYAEAVGEDALVARLRGAELGRATIELLQHGGIVPVSVGAVPSQPAAAAQEQGARLWNDLPGELEVDPEPLALRRPTEPGVGAGGRIVTLGERVALDIDEEPRTWGALVVAFTPEGSVALAEARARLGAPLIVTGAMPARLRAGEPVSLSLVVTNASPQDRQLAITVGGAAPIEGTSESLALPAGTARAITIELRGTAIGAGEATITLSESNEPIRTVRWRVAVDAGLHPWRVRSATALFREQWQTRLEQPASATRAIARVVVMHPSALHRDPDLVERREHDAATLAWAATMAGAPIDPELRARLLSAQQPDGSFTGHDRAVATACAIVALSALAEEDDDAAAALQRARWALQSTSSDDLASWSQQLVALAAAGVPDPADAEEAELDPVSAYAAQLRTRIRRALRRVPEEPVVLARLAAGLLLADPRDAYGRVMFERARAAVVDVESGGGLVVRTREPRDSGFEQLSSTLALALAAHQLGESELAVRLVAGALDRDHVIARRGGEPLFWMLAAASYGVLGAGDAPSLALVANGRSYAVEFTNGIAVIPIDHARDVDVSLRRGGPGVHVIARAETVLDLPFRAIDRAPIELSLDGDPGDAGDVAALELTVRARERIPSGVVVDLQLPAGVEADEALLQLVRDRGALDVARREPRFVRVTLPAMEAGVAAVLPLPLRWSVHGTLEGLAVIAHPADAPGAITVLAPRPLEVAPPRDVE
ncbi:alpha-2-macroglobulin family protein [Sandaracinus amylolyticus]|uniref:alpha-2-macroglobulin family protein n=1 Tax=Sandaracinus amylolyticus TaxID=927083 RepID=UPI0012EE2843|nr:alpha-2-macroglobulin family protein [Sandaracinus amylolyticus]